MSSPSTISYPLSSNYIDLCELNLSILPHLMTFVQIASPTLSAVLYPGHLENSSISFKTQPWQHFSLMPSLPLPSGVLPQGPTLVLVHCVTCLFFFSSIGENVEIKDQELRNLLPLSLP